MDQVSLFNLMMQHLAGQGQQEAPAEEAPPQPPQVGLPRPKRPVGVLPLPTPEGMGWGGRPPPSVAPTPGPTPALSPAGPQAGVPFDPSMEWLASLPNRPGVAGAPTPGTTPAVTGQAPTPPVAPGGFSLTGGPTSSDVNWRQNPTQFAQNFQDFYKKIGPYRDPFAPTNGVSRTMEMGAPGTYDLMQYKMREAHQEQAMQDYTKLLAQDNVRTGAQAEAAGRLDVARIHAMIEKGKAIDELTRTTTDPKQLALKIEQLQLARRLGQDEKSAAFGGGGGGGGSLSVSGSNRPVAVDPKQRLADIATEIQNIPTEDEKKKVLDYIKLPTSNPDELVTGYLAGSDKVLKHPPALAEIVAALRAGGTAMGGRTIQQKKDLLERGLIRHARELMYEPNEVVDARGQDFGGLNLRWNKTSGLRGQHKFYLTPPGGAGTERAYYDVPGAGVATGFEEWQRNTQDKTNALYRQRANSYGALLKALYALE